MLHRYIGIGNRHRHIDQLILCVDKNSRDSLYVYVYGYIDIQYEQENYIFYCFINNFFRVLFGVLEYPKQALAIKSITYLYV